MTPESPEDLMWKIGAWMAFMLVTAAFCAYMLYHSKREAKRLIAKKEAWGTDTLSADDPVAVARIRRRLIIFYSVLIVICALVNLKSFMALMELRSRIQVEGQGKTVVTADGTRSGGHEAGSGVEATASATPNNEAHVPPSKQPPPRQQARLDPDKSAMVLVPGGTFWMGISDDERDRVIEACKTEVTKQATSCPGWVLTAQPRHQVTLDPFSLDPYEVTNRQFEQFVQATNYRTTAEKEGTAFVLTNSQQGWQSRPSRRQRLVV
jgi:hypothetical protein